MRVLMPRGQFDAPVRQRLRRAARRISDRQPEGIETIIPRRGYFIVVPKTGADEDAAAKLAVTLLRLYANIDFAYDVFDQEPMLTAGAVSADAV